MRTLLSPADVSGQIAKLPGWSVDGAQIRKAFSFKNFSAAIGFINAVAVCAEKADHHPDMLLHVWNKVDVMLSTHSAKGITMMDFNLAAAIEGLGL